MHATLGFFLLSLFGGFVSAQVTPQCNPQAVKPAPKGLICAKQGSLTSPAIIAQSTVNTFNDCRDACLGSTSCLSFSFRFNGGKTSGICRTYSKTTKGMGFKRAATGRYFYSRNCFACANFYLLDISDTSSNNTYGGAGSNNGALVAFVDTTPSSLFGLGTSGQLFQNSQDTISFATVNATAGGTYQDVPLYTQDYLGSPSGNGLSVLLCQITTSSTLTCSADGFNTLQLNTNANILQISTGPGPMGGGFAVTLQVQQAPQG